MIFIYDRLKMLDLNILFQTCNGTNKRKKQYYSFVQQGLKVFCVESFVTCLKNMLYLMMSDIVAPQLQRKAELLS